LYELAKLFLGLAIAAAILSALKLVLVGVEKFFFDEFV
jgi:hypothetical protein